MPAGRRIIRLTGDTPSVAREARFESEARLHDPVALHPEVLPNEDFGLGPLVPLAKELDLGVGRMDLLATDGSGRLAIVEFKRGTETPDIRKVVAQLLDYGSSLWRYGYEALEAACRSCHPGFAGDLVDHVAACHQKLDEPFEPETFQSGLCAVLDSGAFMFVYCGRDLDDRSRRIMTYLAEGPRMTFFAVEVEYYVDTDGSGSILVPRTAFVPSWITGPSVSATHRSSAALVMENAPPAFHEVVGLMDATAKVLGLRVEKRATGWMYLPAHVREDEDAEDAKYGVGVYASSLGVQIALDILRKFHRGDDADKYFAIWKRSPGSHSQDRSSGQRSHANRF